MENLNILLESSRARIGDLRRECKAQVKRFSGASTIADVTLRRTQRAFRYHAWFGREFIVLCERETVTFIGRSSFLYSESVSYWALTGEANELVLASQKPDVLYIPLELNIKIQEPVPSSILIIRNQT
jgi:hypothetical protein